MIVSSLFNTIYPRSQSLVARGDEQALVRLYSWSDPLWQCSFCFGSRIGAVFTDFLQLVDQKSEVHGTPDRLRLY